MKWSNLNGLSKKLIVRIFWTLFICLMGALVAAVIISQTSCSPVCKSGIARCNATKAELCDKNGDWRLVMDCAKVHPVDRKWKCCCNKGRCACKPTNGAKR